MGGGPSDLTFPVSPFLGRWDVTSTLIKVDLPLGPDFVPDMQVRCTRFLRRRPPQASFVELQRLTERLSARLILCLLCNTPAC